jgi:hypothetical protein
LGWGLRTSSTKGKIESGGSEVGKQQVDLDEAIGVAHEAFEDGLYFVVDDVQVEEIDQLVYLEPDRRVTFIRLTPLAGGWDCGRRFLPFADDDPRTAEVVSKVILLAKDFEIQDPIILDQLRRWFRRAGDVSPPVRVHKVRELFRATGNTIIGLEFSVSGDSMLKTLRQWFNFRRITKAANLFLESLGPAFTKTTGGHIQTDIAGASAVAGLCVLRNAEPNLESVPPGTPFLCEIHAAQSDVLDFMTRMSFNMGMGGLNGWEAPISSARPC